VLAAYLLLTLLLAPASGAAQSFEIRPSTLQIYREDTLRIVYTGKTQAVTVTHTPPTGFAMNTEGRLNSTGAEGMIDLTPDNATEGVYQYNLTFLSGGPYTIAVAIMRYNETTTYVKEMSGTVPQTVKILRSIREPVAEYLCPASVAVQVSLSIQILTRAPAQTTPSLISTLTTLPRVPEWTIGLYTATLAPFFGIALLNIRDLRKARKVVWTHRYSAAVMLRHLLYGLTLTFFILGAIFLATLIGGVILRIVPIQGWVSIWTLLASALLIVPLGIAYGLARRSGIYDDLDGIG